MTEKQIFFINNDLQNLEVFYQQIKENTQFQTELLSIEDCESDYIQGILKELKPVNLVIVIASEFYKSVAEKLTKQLHSLYNIRFTNVVLLYQDLENYRNLPASELELYYAFYSPEYDVKLQAAYFSQYLLTIFDKAVTQDRLNDYICNSFREVVYSELLAKKNKRIKSLNAELEKKNKIDHLTGLLNREALMDLLMSEIKRTRRHVWRIEHSPLGALPPEGQLPVGNFGCFFNKPAGGLREHLSFFSLLYIQIAGFGKLNDEHGFLKGDEVLLGLAEVLRASGILRSEDIAGRLGAGNFLVILSATNSEHALIPARRIAEKFAARVFPTFGSGFSARVAIGITQYSGGNEDQATLIDQASRALKIARNQDGELIRVNPDESK